MFKLVLAWSSFLCHSFAVCLRVSQLICTCPVLANSVPCCCFHFLPVTLLLHICDNLTSLMLLILLRLFLSQSSSLLTSMQSSSEVPSAAELVSAIEKLVKTKMVSAFECVQAQTKRFFVLGTTRNIMCTPERLHWPQHDVSTSSWVL